MSFTNYMEKNILDHIFGGEDYARPATLQVGLSLTEIQEDGTGITEPMNGYARQEIVNDINTWQVASTDSEGRGVKVNRIVIEFSEATEKWGIITHFFLSDGTNTIGYGRLAHQKEIRAGDVARFRAGELVITLD